MKRNNSSKPKQRLIQRTALGAALFMLTLGMTSPAWAATYGYGGHTVTTDVSGNMRLYADGDRTTSTTQPTGAVTVNINAGSGILHVYDDIQFDTIRSTNANWNANPANSLSLLPTNQTFSGTVNVNSGTLNVTGDVYRVTGASNAGSNLNVATNAALMVDGNLGTGITVGSITNNAILGVQGNISSNVTIGSGGTLKIGGNTTGLNNVTVNTGVAGATITNYGNNNLNFSTGNTPSFNITGAGALNIYNESSGGNIIFANGFSGVNVSGNGNLNIITEDGNIGFGTSGGFTHNTGTHTGGVTIAAGGDGNINARGAFNTTLNGGALDISTSGGNISLNTFSHTNGGNGNVSIQADGNGAITVANDFATDMTGGALTITTNNNHISFSGAFKHKNALGGNVEISIANSGSILFSKSAEFDMAGGNLLIQNHDNNITFNNTFTHTNSGNGNLTITTYSGDVKTSGVFYSAITGMGDITIGATNTGNVFFGADASTSTGGGNLLVSAKNGNINFNGDYSHTSGGTGNMEISVGTNGNTITINGDLSGSLAGGNTTVSTVNGDITVHGGYSHTNTGYGHVLITPGTASNGSGDITFGGDVTSRMNGGDYTIYAKNGNIIINGNLTQDNDGAGDYTVAVGKPGNIITITGDTDLNLTGGDTLFETIDTDLNFQGAFSNINNGNGNLTIHTVTKGNITVGDDFTSSLKNSDANIITPNGNIHFKGTFGHANIGAGDLNIQVGTDGNTITFDKDFSNSLGSGQTMISTKDGDITFDGALTHTNTADSPAGGANRPGGFNVIAGGSGSISVADAVISTMNGGVFNMITQTGDITYNGAFTHTNDDSGDMNILSQVEGDIAFNGDYTVTMTGGDASIIATKGDIHFVGLMGHTNNDQGDLNIQVGTDGNTITFDQDVTINEAGGKVNITTADGDITLSGALTHNNDDDGEFNMLAGGSGNVKVAGVVNSNMFSGNFNVTTQNGNIDFDSAFAHTNAGAGDVNIRAQTEGNITFGDDFSTSLTGGSLNVVAKNGDIHFMGATTHADNGTGGDMNIIVQTAGNTITFEDDLSVTLNGGQSMISTVDGDITINGDLTNVNNSNSPAGTNRNGGFNIIAGGTGNITVTGVTSSTMAGGVFNVITDNGHIHFQDTVTHANSAAGDMNIIVNTAGNITFDKDVTTTLTGSDLNIGTQDGDILFSGKFTHQDLAGGNAYIIAGTAGNTITFKDAVNMTLNGDGETEISTPDGNITFDDVFNYKGENGNLVVNAGLAGDIYFNFTGTNTVDFTGGTGHAYFMTQNGQVHVLGHFDFKGGTGDLYKEAQDGTIPGDINVADSSFTAGGGSAFYSADNNIDMNYAAGAGPLSYDFTGQTNGGLGMAASRDITMHTDFTYIGGNGMGMSNPPNASLELHGVDVAGYGLYIVAQNRKDGVYDPTVTDPSISVLTFKGNSDVIMNGQRGYIGSPIMINKGTTLFDTFTGAGADTNLVVEADQWYIWDDLTINGGETHIASWSWFDDYDLKHDMPELYMMGENSTLAVASPQTQQIIVTYKNSGYTNIFNYVEANDSTVSFRTSEAGADHENGNIRTELLRVLSDVSFAADDANNLSGRVTLLGGDLLITRSFADSTLDSVAGDYGMFASNMYLGKETYYDAAHGFGSPGTYGDDYQRDAFNMAGGFLSFRSADSTIIFDNAYVVTSSGLSSDVFTVDSNIDWDKVDLYGWMNLRDARTVMAAAMVPEQYTYPTQELLTDPLVMGYQDRVWFSVDNTGLTADQSITLADIPGFEAIRAYNPFPDSPFFNLELGYLNDEKTEWGLIDFSRKMVDDTNPANLENQAPNKALGSMAAVIEASPELDIMNNTTLSGDEEDGVFLNTVENVLYLSPTRHAYNKSLAAISAGGNLDAVRMVDYSTLGNVFSRLGQKTIRTCAGTFMGYGSGFWGKANYRRMDMDDNFSKGYGGFDINSIGVTAGYDFNIADDYVIGGFLSYNNADLNGWQRDIDMDDIQIGIYGQAILPADFTVSAGITLGWQNYDLKRNINFGRDFLHVADVSYRDRIKGDFDGRSMQFAVEIAKTICLTESLYIRPTIGYSYQRTKLDGYTEKSQTYYDADAGRSVAQKVGSTTYEQHLISIGASAGYQTNQFALNLGASWVFNAGDKQARANARFANALSAEGSQAFRIYGAKYSDNFVNVNASLMYTPESIDGLSLGVYYDGMFGSKETAHAVSATITFTF